jgi:hypothetical protein
MVTPSDWGHDWILTEPPMCTVPPGVVLDGETLTEPFAFEFASADPPRTTVARTVARTVPDWKSRFMIASLLGARLNRAAIHDVDY